MCCWYAIRIVKSIKRFERRRLLCFAQHLESLCSFSTGLRPSHSIRLALFWTFAQHFESLSSFRLVVDFELRLRTMSILSLCFAQYLESLCSLLTNCLCFNFNLPLVRWILGVALLVVDLPLSQSFLLCFAKHFVSSFLDSLDCSSPRPATESLRARVLS